MAKQYHFDDIVPERKASCYESHPGMPITTEAGTFQIYGGSCSHPAVKDAEIYVALQSGGTSGRVSDPWDAEQKVIEVQYSIPDQGIPSNIPRFKKMIQWLCTQLQSGKKIHVGCIGGHGRTGMVLSAIVAHLGEKDAVQYVRNHYCKRAVESDVQMQFLHKHFGATMAKTRAPRLDFGKDFGTSYGYSDKNGIAAYYDQLNSQPVKHFSSKGKQYAPVASSRCIWRQKSK